jgi:hypothetical protein
VLLSGSSKRHCRGGKLSSGSLVFIRRGVVFVRECRRQGALLSRGGAFVEGGAALPSRGCVGGAGRSKWKVER